MITMEQTANGVILPVHAQPGARKNAIVGEHAGRLKVAVTQAPEKGKANQAIVEVLAASLGLKRSQIALVSGETSPRKKFLIRDITLTDLHQRISAVV